MATVGLKVQGSGLDGSFSLADTLAKAAFGDPEGIMKARLMASQVGAHDAYAANLAEKTREDKIMQGNRDVAGPAAGDAFAAAVPPPAIVSDQSDLRRIAPTGTAYGPQFPHADPVEVARVDKLRAAERTLGPIIVNGNPEQVAKGFNTQYGGAVLSGAIGNPAIVNPDSLRLASTLYTGSAPTTSTVMTSGDFAGVDAAAREKILTERGKPAAAPAHFKDPSGNEVQWDPQSQGWIKAPGTGVAPAEAPTHFKDPAGNELQWDPASQKWIKAPGAGAAPAAVPDTFTGPDGKTYAKVVDPTTGKLVAQLVEGAGAAPVKPVQLDEKSFVPNADGTGYVTPKTDRPLITEDPPDPGSEKGRGKIIRDVMTLASQPVDPLRPNITPQQARDYDQAYTGTYGGKTSVMKIPNTDPANGPLGVPVDTEITVYPDRPGYFLTPKEIYKRARVAPPEAPPAGAPAGTAGQPAATPAPTPAPPVDAGAPAPAPAPSLVGGPAPVIVGGGPSNVRIGRATGPTPPPGPLKADETKERSYLTMGHNSNAILSKFTPKNIPYGADIANADRASSPGLISSIIGAGTSKAAKEYNGAAKAFIEAYARPATGATISPADYNNFYGALIPLPTDPPSEFDRKTQLRNDLEQVWAAGSGFNGEADRDAWFKAHGAHVGKAAAPSGGGGKAPAPAAPADDKPPASYPGSPASWKHVSPEDRKAFP